VRSQRSTQIGKLCAQEHRVVVAELGGRIPETVGARLIGAVAGFGRATDVDHDRVAGLEHPIGHFRVRAGAVGPGSHDDEVDPGVTFGDDRVGYVTTHLALGATDPQPHSAIRACTRSMAAPARRRAWISAVLLFIRSRRSTGPATTCST